MLHSTTWSWGHCCQWNAHEPLVKGYQWENHWRQSIILESDFISPLHSYHKHSCRSYRELRTTWRNVAPLTTNVWKIIPWANWCSVAFPALQVLEEMETKPCSHLLETEPSLLGHPELCWFIVAAEGMELGILRVFNDLEGYSDQQGQSDTEGFFSEVLWSLGEAPGRGGTPRVPQDPGGPCQLLSLGTGTAGETFGVATHNPTVNTTLGIKKSLNLQEFFWLSPALLISTAVPPLDKARIFHPPHPGIHWLGSKTSCKPPWTLISWQPDFPAPFLTLWEPPGYPQHPLGSHWDHTLAQNWWDLGTGLCCWSIPAISKPVPLWKRCISNFKLFHF